MMKCRHVPICILILTIFCSCGDERDADTTVTPNSIFINMDNSEWVTVSEEYIAELLEIEIPPLSEWIGNTELEIKYRYAALLQHHGDIPAVRTIIEFELNIEPNEVIEEDAFDKLISYLEAHLVISPNEDAQEALEVVREVVRKRREQADIDLDRLHEEDPELYVENLHDMLIEEFGDIPEVHTYTRILLKILLGEPITKEEHEEYRAAAEVLER